VKTDLTIIHSIPYRHEHQTKKCTPKLYKIQLTTVQTTIKYLEHTWL